MKPAVVLLATLLVLQGEVTISRALIIEQQQLLPTLKAARSSLCLHKIVMLTKLLFLLCRIMGEGLGLLLAHCWVVTSAVVLQSIQLLQDALQHTRRIVLC